MDSRHLYKNPIAARRHFVCILLTLLFIGLIILGDPAQAPCKRSGSTNPATLLKQADRQRKLLYASPRKKKYRHNWLKCIDRYKRIYTSYPETDQAVWALYHAAKLYTGLYIYSRKQKDLDNALLLYKKLVNEYSKHRLADDAQYKTGWIFYKYKKDPAQAYLEFLKVDIRFPSGDMRPKAKKMLDKLAVTLSREEDKRIREKRSSSPRARAVTVRGIRHWSTDNYTRVVIDLDGPVKYEYHLLKADPRLKKPPRLYIDIKNAFVASEINKTLTIADGLLKGARAGQYTRNTVRVVLDIETIGRYKAFHLYDPFRIVVDARGVNKKKKKIVHAKSGHKKRHVTKGIKKVKSPDTAVSLARQLGLNVDRVVIDPGHGGKDPGCIFGKGIKEKNIVLHIAKLLSKKIEQRIGCKVFLTRDRDIFLPLERRTAIANLKKADLFISLHVNAHRNRKVKGIETYFLNMATDERAVMVAARENATSQKNISDLQSILNDLMLNTKIHESSRLAHKVQQGVVSRLKTSYKKVKSLGVKQAPFYVLIGAQMPAILVETGFITNSTERQRLLNRAYEEKLAEGICKGITDYIKSIDQVAYLPTS